MQAWLKLFTSVCILLFSNLFLDAKEPQGYKIVLASFATFEEAKDALSHVEEKLSNQERSLQKAEKFEIVARPSGKGFIVGLEPIESEASTKRILKQFKNIYPDAYSSGYFGSTEGSIVLGSLSEESNDANSTLQEKPIEVEQEITTPKEPARVVEPNHSNRMFYLFMVIGLAVILGGAYYARKIISPYLDKMQEKKKPLEDEEQFDRVSLVQQIGNALEDEDHPDAQRYDSDESLNRDIYYRFKKNTFFMQNLRELKEASDRKDIDMCYVVMKEILLYQQHFRPSPMIQRLRYFVENGSFGNLSKFLESEIK